ncbi:hypothetical protein K469DRAFT_602827 [Zopfia rhizophila CBS 207.26]|uniref:Fungal N-terminal domain-containing protein n=1 Tax=Zopfia rhizophila CBS 207.26 TaxID=1314779 RepID=A0A6A6DDG1_9PEZI|nr:hypothetical protein K469DRAFT_602827 [Zopfia rhizophila CBS 207.26]
MSFGISISDVITLVQLTSRTYNGWKSACGDYADITSDLAVFQALMVRFAAEAQAPNSLLAREPDDLRGWKRLSKGCRSLLTELEGALKRYKSLGTSRRRNWERIRFGCRNLDSLRQQLVTKTTSLSAYMSVLGISSQGRIENETLPQLLGRVNDIAAQIGKGNASVVSCFTSYDDDDKAVWREFRRDLIQSGFRSADIRKYSAALKTHLGRLQRSGYLDEEDSKVHLPRFVILQAPLCLLSQL